MNVDEAIRSRRSVRSFTSRPVSSELLSSLLELALHAPNHRRTEPWEFLVLGPSSRRTWGRLKGRLRAEKTGAAPERAEALVEEMGRDAEALPAAVAFVQRLAADPDVREEDYATLWMGIQNVLLGAVEAGLATQIRTGPAVNHPETLAAFGVGEERRIVAIVELGEPDGEPAPWIRDPVERRTRHLP